MIHVIAAALVMAVAACWWPHSSGNRDFTAEAARAVELFAGTSSGIITSNQQMAVLCPYHGQSFSMVISLDLAQLECQDEDARADCTDADDAILPGTATLHIDTSTFVHDPVIVEFSTYGSDDAVDLNLIMTPPPNWPAHDVAVSAVLDGDSTLNGFLYRATDAGYECVLTISDRQP